MELIVKRKL
jgi:hypothetical protein